MAEEQKWRCLAIVFLILNVLLLVITLTVVILWVKDRENRQLTPQTSTFCLPREKVSLHKDDDEENFKHFESKTENGKQFLCTETVEHLASLVNLYVERMYKIERANKPCYSYCDGYKDSNKKPVARVRGIEYTSPVDDQPNTHEVFWHAEEQQSFVNGVTYMNGRFVVVQKGYYYIYSQVTFKHSKFTDILNTIFRHLIFKIKGKKKETLLESFQSTCQLQEQTCNSSSYIGSVFYLKEYDEVQVHVTYPDNITKSPYSNYFGLHMI